MDERHCACLPASRDWNVIGFKIQIAKRGRFGKMVQRTQRTTTSDACHGTSTVQYSNLLYNSHAFVDREEGNTSTLVSFWYVLMSTYNGLNATTILIGPCFRAPAMRQISELPRRQCDRFRKVQGDKVRSIRAGNATDFGACAPAMRQIPHDSATIQKCWLRQKELTSIPIGNTTRRLEEISQ